MTSNQPSAATQKHIEDNLRRAFAEEVDTAMPKQFEALLLQLKQQDGDARSSDPR